MRFQSPHDGSEMLLTPEHSVAIQNTIGADIIMQLDDVVHSMTTGQIWLPLNCMWILHLSKPINFYAYATPDTSLYILDKVVVSPTLLKMGSYSSTTICQYWDNRLIY